MNTLLFLNNIKGAEMGIEDGFLHLRDVGKIANIEYFYYLDYYRNNTLDATLSEMLNIAIKFQPGIIIFFHVGRFPITQEFIAKLRQIESNPIIVYDEGDMYGGWAKRVTPSMETMLRYSDFISIRGLGKWYKTVKKFNKNIIYTPHSNSLDRQTKNISPAIRKEKKIVFIGNRTISRIWIRRLHGAWGREKFVKYINTFFPNTFNIYGRGWHKLSCNKGKLDFIKQTEVCSSLFFHVSYEHYPEIPYYFSDRLPIALSCGQIYICHYHRGYENIFKNCDFIYFFNSHDEAVDIISYLMSLSEEQLYLKSENAKKWADENLSPQVVWGNLVDSILAATKK